MGRHKQSRAKAKGIPSTTKPVPTHADVDATPRTHLDIIITTLSNVTGMPAAHFRASIMRGMAASGQDTSHSELLRELTDEEVNKHLSVLSTPEAKKGVLRWIVEARVMANATPAQRQRMKMYADNRQN